MFGYSSGPYCPVCNSYHIVRFIEQNIVDGRILFLCHCRECGCTGDFYGINDEANTLLQAWIKLPEGEE